MEVVLIRAEELVAELVQGVSPLLRVDHLDLLWSTESVLNPIVRRRWFSHAIDE